MRIGYTKGWIATLFGLLLLFAADVGHAENTRAPITESEWQKGKLLSPSNEQIVQLCSSTQVHLKANSKTEILGKIPLPTSIGGVEPFANTARLLQGRMDVAINRKDGPACALLVSGPRRTTVLASSGQVSVVVNNVGMAVGVYEGKEAAVSIGSDWKHVTAGKMLVVSAQHPEGFVSRLPSGPSKVVVTRPMLAVTGLNAPSRAIWQKLPHAVSYRVKIRNLQNDENRYLETPEAAIELGELSTAGRYEVRVATAGQFGLYGDYSEPAYVSVVGVELPPGGYFSGGKAFVEPGQQLKLTYIEGLEMSYEAATFYFDAIDRTGLQNNRALTFHLRLPGSKERVSLEVAPRSLETKIELVPTLARWPRDKIHIVVHLPKTVDLSPNVELKASVTVNGKVVEPKWIKLATTIETVLPQPPVYPGPWVIRVEVTDQHGYVLGHNFLEVASMAD